MNADATSTPLHPDLLEQAKGLVARVMALVAGGRTGVHRSRRLGGGSEFSEYKSYEAGDDLRHLDWRVQARTDRYVVKQFESDRTTDVRIVLDRSGSMAFGTTGGRPATAWGPWPSSKWEAASILALGLAFLFLRQGDRVGLTLVDGQGVPVIPPRGGGRHLLELAARTIESGPAGAGDLDAALATTASIARRGTIMLVSDLLSDESETWPRPLAVHAARGRDVQVLHVVDPAEITFPYEEPTRFADLETQDLLSANPRELARSYQEAFAAFVQRQRVACLDKGLRYVLVDTGQPLEEAFRGLLEDDAPRRISRGR